MDLQMAIEWMKAHAEKQQIVLGVDGFERSPKFDAFFKQRFTKYFAERITLMVMILLSEEEAKIFVNAKRYNFKKLGLNHLAQTLSKVLQDDNQRLEIVFERRIPDTVEYPHLERTYQYLLVIDDLLDTAFYHVPAKRQDYFQRLVDKQNLSLKDE